MNKKQIIINFLILCFLSMSSFAQNKGDKVESIKVAYLAEKLNLDSKTAERFWPIYNQYDDEMKQVIQESKRSNDNRDPEEILDREQKAIDIKRKYSVLFLKVISNEQLSQLYQSEKEFHRMLIKRMNRMENRQQRMQENPNQRFQNRPRMSPARSQETQQEQRMQSQPRRTPTTETEPINQRRSR